jgi:ribonuclease VapC
MSKYILDSSALLALINYEPGWENISKIVDNSSINTINLSEVIHKLYDLSLSELNINKIFQTLNFKIIKFDREMAFEAGKLKNQTKQFGLSLGDCACIATAIINKFDILTADKIWLKLDLPIKVISIR